METQAGKIAARAAIITVSSNVLTAGNIKFTPEFPKRQLDAAARLNLGSYDHIALQMPGNPLGLGREDIIIEQSNSTRTALLFANIGGSSLCSWNASPFALGAMSSAAPGAQPSRKILTEPIGALFLAGEATHETLWGTVDGAWDSGERAADAALRKIGALRDTEPVAPAPVTKRRRRTGPGAPIN